MGSNQWRRNGRPHQWLTLRRIAEFYAVEADLRGLDPGQRHSGRQARTAPLVAAFGDWLQQSRLRVSAKSRLGEKLAYIHRHWEPLQTFLHDGRVEIDSNGAENLIRPIALNRKNALFAGHDEGGKAWGRIASLIETAKINGVEPCQRRSKIRPDGGAKGGQFGLSVTGAKWLRPVSRAPQIAGG